MLLNILIFRLSQKISDMGNRQKENAFSELSVMPVRDRHCNLSLKLKGSSLTIWKSPMYRRYNGRLKR